MSAIAYFELRLIPGPPEEGELPRTEIHIPARPGREVEQWHKLIAHTDPDVFTLAPHAADGTVCGLDGPGATS